MKKKAALFDLDGVLVDTAKYHYIAWQYLAKRLGIIFTKQDNERLKGVSRKDSLDILLSLGNKQYSIEEKEKMENEKNEIYVDFIKDMNESEILPSVLNTLMDLKEKNIKIALGSASKNADLILSNIGLKQYFDTIVDGTNVSAAKPDPEVFVVGAKQLGVEASDCVVFEDSEAGCKAGKSAGMYVVGIGEIENLPSADMVISNFSQLTIDNLF